MQTIDQLNRLAATLSAVSEKVSKMVEPPDNYRPHAWLNKRPLPPVDAGKRTFRSPPLADIKRG